MRATDILPDDADHSEINGVTIRKGSVGAFLANARLLVAPATTPEARALAERDIIDQLPALRALGLFEVFLVRDEKLRRLVDAH